MHATLLVILFVCSVVYGQQGLEGPVKLLNFTGGRFATAFTRALIGSNDSLIALALGNINNIGLMQYQLNSTGDPNLVSSYAISGGAGSVAVGGPSDSLIVSTSTSPSPSLLYTWTRAQSNAIAWTGDGSVTGFLNTKSLVLTPDGAHLYVGNSSHRINHYTVGPTPGVYAYTAFTDLALSGIASVTDMRVVDNYLYEFHSASSIIIYQFSITAGTGVLVTLSPATVQVPPPPTAFVDIAVSSDKKNLYLLSTSPTPSCTIMQGSRNTADGTLTFSGATYLTASTVACKAVTLTQDGLWAFVGANDGTVYQFSRDPVSGDLAALPIPYFLNVCPVGWQIQGLATAFVLPSETPAPTPQPTATPTLQPTATPTFQPTATPTLQPTTLTPTSTPTLQPTATPTLQPSTLSPTTLAPTATPTLAPTATPTLAPTYADDSVDCGPVNTCWLTYTCYQTNSDGACRVVSHYVYACTGQDNTILTISAPTPSPSTRLVTIAGGSLSVPFVQSGTSVVVEYNYRIRNGTIVILTGTSDNSVMVVSGGGTVSAASLSVGAPSLSLPTVDFEVEVLILSADHAINYGVINPIDANGMAVPFACNTSFLFPPTPVPTKAPTVSPTVSPTTLSPTVSPSTLIPSATPTLNPTPTPTGGPTTLNPTLPPTLLPTLSPTPSPTPSPTSSPTRAPTTLVPTSLPTVAPTASPTAVPTLIPTLQPTSSPTPVPTLQPTASPTRSPTRKPTATPTLLPTPAPTPGPTTAPTPTPTTTPTPQPTTSPTTIPTESPTRQPTATPTQAPTHRPTTIPTTSPTHLPTSLPTTIPTRSPTRQPTQTPTNDPTFQPTSSPSPSPTTTPTLLPTPLPTATPTVSPTPSPTVSPSTLAPTPQPTTLSPTPATPSPTTLSPSVSPSTLSPTTLIPTRLPTSIPTLIPTQIPTTIPTHTPTHVPTSVPTSAPTSTPTTLPTTLPTPAPSLSPTPQPSLAPTPGPTPSPTIVPTPGPTNDPTNSPTPNPTNHPTRAPTNTPTLKPTREPTSAPTHVPTLAPSHIPTNAPTASPTVSPTPFPTSDPTSAPTLNPSASPTLSPTSSPTFHPTTSPTSAPSSSPTSRPTFLPTLAPSPTDCQLFDEECIQNSTCYNAGPFHEQCKLISIPTPACEGQQHAPDLLEIVVVGPQTRRIVFLDDATIGSLGGSTEQVNLVLVWRVIDESGNVVIFSMSTFNGVLVVNGTTEDLEDLHVSMTITQSALITVGSAVEVEVFVQSANNSLSLGMVPELDGQGLAQPYICVTYTLQPTVVPTPYPSMLPTPFPSYAPSTSPTRSPSISPSVHSTGSPTKVPSLTSTPSNKPTSRPTMLPSAGPSRAPSQIPTPLPSTSTPSSQSTTTGPTLSPTVGSILGVPQPSFYLHRPFIVSGRLVINTSTPGRIGVPVTVASAGFLVCLVSLWFEIGSGSRGVGDIF